MKHSRKRIRQTADIPSASLKAEKLARKLKRKGVTFNSLKDYAQRLGYSVLFYNSPEGAAFINACSLSNLAQTKEAFTVNAEIKAIFISQNVDAKRIIFLILRELGHIELGHIGFLTHEDPHPEETEASAFAYTVLQPGRKRFSVLTLCLTAAIAFLIGLSLTLIPFTPASSPAQKTAEELIKKDRVLNRSEQVFYITEGGSKYHLRTCQYVTSGAIPVYYDEIQDTHEPCRACNPDGKKRVAAKSGGFSLSEYIQSKKQDKEENVIANLLFPK